MNEVQAVALIHSPAEGRLFPEVLVVQTGLPVRLYNLATSAVLSAGLRGEHQVTIEPFVTQATPVEAKKITVMEFTPNQAGEFAIRSQGEAPIGRLVVRDSLCPGD